MNSSLIIGIPVSILAVFGAIYLAQEVTLIQANDIFEQYQSDSLEKKIQCSGTARCLQGTITDIVDGDTVKVNNQSIRFALSSAPELNEEGGIEAKEFIEKLCPLGSTAIVDEDDFQTDGSYGRIVGVVTCNQINLNSALVNSEYGEISKSFCSTSEFSNSSWANFACK